MFHFFLACASRENKLKAKYYFLNQNYYEISTIYGCVEKLSIIIGCNIWIICLELMFYYPIRMLQLSEFVWTIRSSVWVVFINFLLLDATDRTMFSSDRHRLFFDVSLYPLSFFANTPFIKNVLPNTAWNLCENV